MKTVLEFVDVIYTRLKSDATLTSSSNGGLYKFTRPDGSLKQDIVVLPLTANNEQLQQCIVNVNAHVPNLSLKINKQPDNSQPDTVKLQSLTSQISSLLNDYWGTGFHCNVQGQSTIKEPGTNEYFSNIRIICYSINI